MQICQFEQINQPVIDVVPRLMPCTEVDGPWAAGASELSANRETPGWTDREAAEIW